MACHLSLHCPLFGILKLYPNLPKFLIDDVIPEVLLIFWQRDPFFWTQRPFLLWKWSSRICLDKKYYIFYITFYIRSRCRNTLIFTHLAPMTSLMWATLSETIAQLWLKGQKYPNFKWGELRQKLIFFDAVFFGRPEIESTMQLSNKNRG